MKQLSKGLIAAGLFNILGAATFTRGFRDFSVGDYFPDLFSMWGMALIVVWGLAFMAVSRGYREVRGLLLVFTLEKVFYFGSWCWWQWHHFLDLPAIWKENPLAGFFYSAYGPLDLAFGFLFLGLFFSAGRK